VSSLFFHTCLRFVISGRQLLILAGSGGSGIWTHARGRSQRHKLLSSSEGDNFVAVFLNRFTAALFTVNQREHTCYLSARVSYGVNCP
jgi:hypothetical protein